MKKLSQINRGLGTAIAAALATATLTVAPSTAHAAQAPAVKPTNDIIVGVGTGRMVRINVPMTDLFVADQGIADVQVRSANQLYIFGKGAGETTIYATNKAGKVVYSANVHVGSNIDSVSHFLHTAMPESKISATPMNGVVLLTGTVKAPEDIEEASRIVQAYVGDGTKIISRLKTATPMQVMLRVRFAEVSRSLGKDLGLNVITRDNDLPGNGFLGSIGKGAPGTITDSNGATVFTFTNDPLKYTFGAAGHAFGMDILASLQLAENDGRASILAEPTLTALSGETASFLAGGEFPIPLAQSLGATSVEYKQYGVGLAFTPTVLDDGRISMRVRPEVSELSDQGSVRMNGFTIPALTTRRAETTVELGSGQSFVIGGLLRNSSNNSVDKAPWLGDLPIIGALFRSNSFRRSETELVIVVTPYLVKPVSDSEIALPTDGFRTSNDAQRILLDRGSSSVSGEARPGPVVVPSSAPAPTAGPAVGPSVKATPIPAKPAASKKGSEQAANNASATPGFSF
jgi:pilus assembly protein CpaC